MRIASGTDVDAGSLLCHNLSKIAVFIVSLFCEEVILMLPLTLVPTGVLKIELPNGQSVEIPKSQPTFESCVKPESTDSFGGKPFVASELGPCFAELLILRMLRNHGWDGRWIETYPPRRGMPLLLTDWDPRGIKSQQTVPIEDADVSSMLVRIAAARGTDMQPKYSCTHGVRSCTVRTVEELVLTSLRLQFSGPLDRPQ